MEVLLWLMASLTVCEFAHIIEIVPLNHINHLNHHNHLFHDFADISYQNRICRMCRQKPIKPCEPPPPPPPTEEPKPKKCNKELTVVRKLAQWHNAHAECRKQGRRLLTINNQEEWEAVKKAIKEAGAPMNYWTSGSDVGLDRYVWTSTGSPVNFTNWGAGEPNNLLGLQHCAFIKSGNFLWDDWDCNLVHFYICEKCKD